jgi:hypothetical protein
MIIGSFSGDAALRRCLTENGQRGKREVRPTAADIGLSTAPLRSETIKRQKALKFIQALAEAPGELDCVGIIT